MIIFSSIAELQNHLQSIRKLEKIIGFVPTMGALHAGHISLIVNAMDGCELVICSIFVNPTQFNDPNDLEKYPRTFEIDAKMLEKAGCDIVFAPTVAEMYSPKEIGQKRLKMDDQSWMKGFPVDFGLLDKVMEGALRPGHFNGVAQVVSKLFDIIKPDKAYFGQKDYQQLAIIRSMVKQLRIPTEIISCPIMREPDGLAMSSRNIRLSSEERAKAPLIFKILKAAAKKWGSQPAQEIKEFVQQEIANEPAMQLDYFDIVDADSLISLPDNRSAKKAVACIAVKLGAVRLIDNIVLY